MATTAPDFGLGFSALTDVLCLQGYAKMAADANFWAWNTHLDDETFLRVKKLFLEGVTPDSLAKARPGVKASAIPVIVKHLTTKDLWKITDQPIFCPFSIISPPIKIEFC